MIVALCFLVPILCIPFTFGKRSIRRSLRLLIFAAVLSFVCSVGVLASWAREGTLRFADNWLVSDSTSRLFIALISTVFTGVALYVYNRALTYPLAARNIQKFVRSTLLFFSISVLAILSNHFILMWLLLEASTLAATPLIYHQKGSASVRGAWRYLLFSSVGLSLAFLGFLCLAEGFAVGFRVAQSPAEVSFFFDHLATFSAQACVHPWKELGLILLFLGFGTKLGLAPMYSWLPETYDTAPPSVTVLLSAIQFNAVMIAVFRIFEFFQPLQSDLVRYELIVLGLVTILVSAFHIVVAKNYKRLIAYASINHAGVIALGLGIGRSAAFGVVLYVISNALVKAILFLTCGNIKARYHTKSILEIKGLIKTMPFSGGLFMVGMFALLGFAPFGSFLGEVLIMKSMIDGQHYAVFALFFLITSIVFVAMGRAIFPMIWGEPNHETSLHGESIYTLLPNLFFIFLLLSLGLYVPPAANALLQDIAIGIGGIQ